MKLLRCMVLFSGIFLLLVPGVSLAEVLTNDAIVTMVKAKLGEELIIAKVKATQNRFDVSTESILKLKREGVSEKVIKAMIESAGSAEAAEPAASAPAPSVDHGTSGEQRAIDLYEQGKLTEAVAAFGELIAAQPNDDRLKIWKAKALLGQAQEMRESKLATQKQVIMNAWSILKSLAQRQQGDPDWNFAVGKALWLNDRSDRARKSIEKAIALRPSFAEAHLILGDIALEDSVARRTKVPYATESSWQDTAGIRKTYERTLAIADLPAKLAAEALYKLGVVSADLEKNHAAAVKYWERAAAADPTCRYGKMAEEKLKTR